MINNINYTDIIGYASLHNRFELAVSFSPSQKINIENDQQLVLHSKKTNRTGFVFGVKQC